MADGVWKGVYTYVFGRSRQPSLNKFFDPIAPFMRKVDDGENPPQKIMSFLMATNVASRPTDWNAACSCQLMLLSLAKVPS